MYNLRCLTSLNSRINTKSLVHTKMYNLRCLTSLNSRINTKSLSLVKFWSSKKINAEEKIKSILTQTFPKANNVDVVDVSGGCGAMFEIVIKSPEFKGLPIVKQHRLVTEALKEEIKDMHGFRIHTSS